MGTRDAKILDQDSIQAGDVLLCYSKMGFDKDEELKDGYVHAAICVESKKILESNRSGVVLTTIDDLFDEYCHIAVFHRNDIWDEVRLSKLRAFADTRIKKKFNVPGIRNYKDTSKRHAMSIYLNYKITLMERLLSSNLNETDTSALS